MSLERSSLAAQADGGDQVDQFAQALLVERRPGVVLGQNALEPGVVALDGNHRVVDDLADGRLLGLALQVRPAGLLRHPEDVLGAVFVGIFGVGPLALSASSRWCISSKESEMYLRKISPRTTCLYSAASMLLRILSAASQSLASNPRLAPLPLDLPDLVETAFLAAIRNYLSSWAGPAGRRRKVEDSSPPTRFHPGHVAIATGNPRG